MPISLAELQNNTRTLTVDYDGQKVTVVYRPALLTTAGSDGFAKLNIVGQMEQLLVSWDVMGDDDKPAPVTGELLGMLPARFLAHIADAVAGDMRPNAKRAVS